MADHTLRDQIAEALRRVNPDAGVGMSDLREQIVGLMPHMSFCGCLDEEPRTTCLTNRQERADAVLAVVEAHVTQKQAEALRDAAGMEVALRDPRIAARWFSAEAAGVSAASAAFRDALRARADELDPRPEDGPDA